MKSNASNMTFCVTCVVDKIVTTHFRNDTVGIASGTSRLTGDDAFVHSSARRRVAVDSNQNRQVICAANSPRLPPLLFIDGGIWRLGRITLFLRTRSSEARE